MHTANSPLKECITHTDRIVLNYDESNLSFDVALLSYSTAEANQYYYRMDPIDKGWIKAATNQNISYAKLPPGQYTFKVKATSNDDGAILWNDHCSLKYYLPGGSPPGHMSFILSGSFA